MDPLKDIRNLRFRGAELNGVDHYVPVGAMWIVSDVPEDSVFPWSAVRITVIGGSPKQLYVHGTAQQVMAAKKSMERGNCPMCGGSMMMWEACGDCQWNTAEYVLAEDIGRWEPKKGEDIK